MGHASPEILDSLRQGTADLERLAAALSVLGEFCLLPTPEELLRRLDAGENGGEKGDGPEDDTRPLLGRLQGDSRVAYVFTSPAAVQEAVQSGIVTDVEEIVVLDRQPVRDVLTRVCGERQGGGIEIDPGSAHALHLEPRELAELCERLRGARGAPGRAAAAGPAPDREIVHTLAPWPLTGRTPAAIRERLARWIRSIQSRPLTDMRTWLFLESVAFEMDFFVPAQKDPTSGFLWPQRVPHPRSASEVVVNLYTGEDGLGAAAGPALLPERPHHVRVSGLEALRWITALPARVDHVVFDDFPGSGHRFEMPHRWAALPLFPLAYPIAALAEIELLPLAKLGALPGVRGAHPKVMRALSAEATQLGTLVDASGAPLLVALEQGRGVVAFSDPARFDAFRTGRALDPGARLQASGGVPPFVRWLGASALAQGVAVDPGSPSELWLDHATLVALAAWTILPTHPLSSDHFLAALVTARNQTSLGEAALGRMLTACPFWYQPIALGPAGPQPLRDPFSGDEPLFGDEGLAREWLEMLDAVNALPASCDVVRLLPRWKSSPFDGALRRNVTLAIQPTELGNCELRIGAAGQRAAAAALDRVLQPRVEGFLT